MNAELHFGWAIENDIAEICSFMADGFGNDSAQANRERIHWLYFSNPHGIHISTCRHKGRLVAACPHILQDVSLAGKMITAAFGIDFFVNTEWRRQGIASQFLTMRRERFELCLSTGQSASMSELYKKIGAKDLGPINIGYGRRRPPALTKPRVFARQSLTWLKFISTKMLNVHDHYKMIPFSIAEPSLNKWQQWRFGPRSPYQDHRFIGDSSGQSHFVTRESNNVLHILGISANIQERATKLRTIVQSTTNDEVQIQFCGDSLMNDCSKAGFLIRPQDARLIAMTNDIEIDQLLKPGCIDLAAESSDTDLMRLPAKN